MLVIFIVTLAATMLIQMYLRNTYSRWQQQPAASGLSGAETARTILRANGLGDVAVEEVPGQLTDHYDPTKRVVRLSTINYRTASVAAHAVAAHEVGHAIQHAQAYGPLKVRSALVPVPTSAPVSRRGSSSAASCLASPTSYWWRHPVRRRRAVPGGYPAGRVRRQPPRQPAAGGSGHSHVR